MSMLTNLPNCFTVCRICIIVIQVNSTFKDMGVPLLQSALHTRMDKLVFHLIRPLIVIKTYLHIQCRLAIWCLMVAFLRCHHHIMLIPFRGINHCFLLTVISVFEALSYMNLQYLYTLKYSNMITC